MLAKLARRGASGPLLYVEQRHLTARAGDVACHGITQA
jgi:hypothetical protein